MTNQIIPFSETQSIAKALAASGFFQDAKSEAQAIVKVLAGQELGLGPFASMTGLHIISGKPVLGANLLATLIKNDRRYNYRIVQLDDKVCEIAFFEQGEDIGHSRFTLDDAKKAGTKNLDKFPRNMLFARAISNGAKWFTPGIFGGAPIYTPEDFGLDTDEDGVIISVEPVREVAPAPTRQAVTYIEPMDLTEAKQVQNSKGEYYWNLPSDTLSHMANAMAKSLRKDDITNERKAELEHKQAAAVAIMQYRNEAQPEGGEA